MRPKAWTAGSEATEGRAYGTGLSVKLRSTSKQIGWYWMSKWYYISISLPLPCPGSRGCWPRLRNNDMFCSPNFHVRVNRT